MSPSTFDRHDFVSSIYRLSRRILSPGQIGAAAFQNLSVKAADSLLELFMPRFTLFYSLVENFVCHNIS